MKTSHKWNESINEKLFFMNTMQATPARARQSVMNSHKPVNFYCAAPGAKQVALAGDFNHWQPLPMHRAMEGWWLARVPLCHGIHKYRFLVDGKPILDPHAAGVTRDEQDERVSLIAVD